MPSLENKYQSNLIDNLHFLFPGCMVLKLDSGYLQGIPDLLVLYQKKWATLECKRSEKAHHQPNQEYYVNKMNGMGFSSFIFPENEKKVLAELGDYFRS